MTEQQILALAASIEHWYEVWNHAVKLTRDRIALGTRTCSCCIQFYENKCQECPIYEHTRKQFCEDTPFDRVDYLTLRKKYWGTAEEDQELIDAVLQNTRSWPA